MQGMDGKGKLGIVGSIGPVNRPRRPAAALNMPENEKAMKIDNKMNKFE